MTRSHVHWSNVVLVKCGMSLAIVPFPYIRLGTNDRGYLFCYGLSIISRHSILNGEILLLYVIIVVYYFCLGFFCLSYFCLCYIGVLFLLVWFRHVTNAWAGNKVSWQGVCYTWCFLDICKIMKPVWNVFSIIPNIWKFKFAYIYGITWL